MPEWWQNSKASDLWASLLSEAYCSVHVHWYRFLCLRVMCVWDTVWRKCYCVQWCVYEVQGEGNVTVYSDVCLRYSVREMLLCTVMCIWGTEWGKCCCVQLCVSEVQGEGNVTLYSDVSEVHNERNVTVYTDVCLRFKMREMLLYTLMCVWGIWWWKCYFLQCCESEVQSEGNVTVCNEVCICDKSEDNFTV